MTADFTWSQRCTHDAATVGGSIPRMKRKRCRINVLLLDAAERRGEGRGALRRRRRRMRG